MNRKNIASEITLSIRSGMSYTQAVDQIRIETQRGADIQTDRDHIPRRAFACPHCHLIQIRVWPAAHGNLCNNCQNEVD